MSTSNEDDDLYAPVAEKKKARKQLDSKSASLFIRKTVKRNFSFSIRGLLYTRRRQEAFGQFCMSKGPFDGLLKKSSQNPT